MPFSWGVVPGSKSKYRLLKAPASELPTEFQPSFAIHHTNLEKLLNFYVSQLPHLLNGGNLLMQGQEKEKCLEIANH